MAAAANPTSASGYYTTSDIVSGFRTMLTHISELFTTDNASSLAYINGLPSASDKSPHKPLEVLMELEKRGVFSHENVEPLIGLLTDLHRVDIINTCGVREYKERAERAKLTRGDSYGKWTNGFAATERQQSLERLNKLDSDPLPFNQSYGFSSVAPPSNEVGDGGGIDQNMPGLKSYHQPSPLTMHSVHSSSSSLAAEGGGKAEIIAKLATDPEAVSIMREVLMSSKDSRDKLFNFREEGTASVVTNDEASQSEATPTSQSEATPTSPSGQSDHLPSPPTGVECKSVNSSLVTYDRHTSSTSTTTDRSESLTLSEAAQIGSLVLSRETDNTFDHDDFLISSPSEDTGPSGRASEGISQMADRSSSSALTDEACASDCSTSAIDELSSSFQSLKYVPEFDSDIEATKVVWRMKRITLCEYICKHSSKSFMKEMKLSCSRPKHYKKKALRLGRSFNNVKLTFHLAPYGVGPDSGRFMSMKVSVHVDQKCPQLKEMALLHLKITTTLPHTDFVTVKTVSNQLEDFVVNDFVPHEIIINQACKNVDFSIEAYLTFGSLDLSEADEEELLKMIKDDSDFTDQYEVLCLGNESDNAN